MQKSRMTTMTKTAISTKTKIAIGVAIAVGAAGIAAFGLLPELNTTTSPQLLSAVPANGELNVPVDQNITVTFNKPMDPRSFWGKTFWLAGPNNPDPRLIEYVTLSPDGLTATLDPAATLLPGRTYYMTTTAEVKDTSGNFLANPSKWSFTTVGTAPSIAATDKTAPRVVAITPGYSSATLDGPGNYPRSAPGSYVQNVPLNQVISVTFDEEMDPATFTANTFRVVLSGTPQTGSMGTNVNGAISYSGKTVYFTPSTGLLLNNTYTVTIGSDVKDVAGNALGYNNALGIGSYTWPFKTVIDSTTPIAATTPAPVVVEPPPTVTPPPVTTTPVTIAPPVVVTAPIITSHPVNLTKRVNETATFTVSATGTAPLSYQWKKNGVNISGATSATYSVFVTPTQVGAYTATVTNAAGSVISNGATLTVITFPTFTRQPISTTKKISETVTFSVSAMSVAPATYQWLKNGVAIVGAISAAYTIPSITVQSAGTYSVVVTNNAGSVTSGGAILTVISPPIITQQPISLTKKIGGIATFKVTSTGTAPLSYQWKKKGVNISGATSATYIISSVTSQSAGTYTVTIINLGGSVTSSGAILTVTP